MSGLTAELVRLERWDEAFEWLSRWYAQSARKVYRAPKATERDLDNRFSKCAVWLRQRNSGVLELKEKAMPLLTNSRSDPSVAIPVIEEYCTALFGESEFLDVPGMIELARVVNALTVKLVRLKRWQEAVDWLTKFEALPARVIYRGTKANESAIAARMLRCYKKLGTS